MIRKQLGLVQTNQVKMIKSEGVPKPVGGAIAVAQVVVFDPKAEMKWILQAFQCLVDEPSETELLAENL